MKKIFVVLMSVQFFALAIGSTATRDTLKERSLDEYLRSHHVTQMEGYISENTDKQLLFFQSLFTTHSWIKTVGEIGFNAGHSSECFLSANSHITVVSFDIMQHSYVHIGKKYIDLKFPGRHQLVGGNSLSTVQQFHKENIDARFDLIFIDGGHDFDTALNDIKNMKSLASKKTLLIVDDINRQSVLNAWNACLTSGCVKEIQRFSSGDKAWVMGQYCFPPT